MCEPLRGKEMLGGLVIDDKELPFFEFEDVKSAVEFYKKYEGKPMYFGGKNLDKWELFSGWHNNNWGVTPLAYKSDELSQRLLIIRFNRWLFDFCFGDVIE